MHGLHYRAIDGQGQIHTGYTNTRSFSELEQWVRLRGWQLLPASLAQRTRNVLGLHPRLPSWTKTNAALFTQNFAQLLEAGVPLIDTLQELKSLENRRRIRRAIADITERVDQGCEISEAMACYPSLFGKDYIASVRAGESSGRLSECLHLQASNLFWQSSLAQRFKTVLAYPAFALICLIAVFLFVLLYLVPAMLPLLSMGTSQLPTHTVWLLKLSSFVLHFGVTTALVFGSIAIALLALSQFSSPVDYRLRLLLLRGAYGQVITSYSLARYARNAGLLYASGVEVTEAMRISQNLVGNAVLKKQLSDAHQRVLRGQSIGKAMQAQAALPALFVRMIVAGEKAGVLDVSLRQCADQLQANTQYSLDRLERLIGPVLLCVMGALLLWVVLSVLGPIYDTVASTGALL